MTNQNSKLQQLISLDRNSDEFDDLFLDVKEDIESFCFTELQNENVDSKTTSMLIEVLDDFITRLKEYNDESE
jgi:hypothetical protein